ncbi:HpcH/HpaI aldolase/citrate lyase family protein [Rhodococcus sp. NCIMB 12038]|uniref:HpcH/HpaI aldolase family protein n=1 Tax=Rhodococcus sp. NCIMB 12038 TaxID=933800 RepID=UPI000B3C335E|nr:HpcH/HpaI aldolase/citrate lyase family protein [Rhodococcus sp. NCIMB 12038]OUS92832.1 2-dehydro-3-deoxyglucarate aldolase [Rhodococcus sp. NCIMB 12038]
MRTPVNEFKRRLSGDQPLIGFWLTLGDTVSAEVCAGAGFDWVVIDGEHGPYDARSVLPVLQAMGGYPDCAPVVRVPTGEPWLLKQYLDAGAPTVLVPMVDTAAQARTVVDACRYPPQGSRGVGGARASRWGRYPDYLKEANDEVCVLIQVETAEALDNLEEILDVEGIDGVFVGAADLAASLGHPGYAAHPEVQSAIRTALALIEKKGLPSGTLATVEETAHAYVEAGVRFVAVGIDAHLLARHTSALAQRFT